MPEASSSSVTAKLQKAVEAQERVKQAARDAAQGKAPAAAPPKGGKA